MGAGLDTLIQDCRNSVRALRKNAGYTVTAALILAMGIGANTALFGTIHSVLLRSLPFPEPQRLVVGLETLNGEWSLLYEVQLLDPEAYAAAVLTLVSIAALASYLPARRVPRGELVNVLRME
jgi:ABC-type lipoprotein release transport system permease subunit